VERAEARLADPFRAARHHARARRGVGRLEGWPLGDAVYFAFVSGLTIGYGDLAPSEPLSRALAICIGFTGILLTGLVAALAVRALETLRR
jgi:hypothetical protein